MSEATFSEYDSTIFEAPSQDSLSNLARFVSAAARTRNGWDMIGDYSFLTDVGMVQLGIQYHLIGRQATEMNDIHIATLRVKETGLTQSTSTKYQLTRKNDDRMPNGKFYELMKVDEQDKRFHIRQDKVFSLLRMLIFREEHAVAYI